MKRYPTLISGSWFILTALAVLAMPALPAVDAPVVAKPTVNTPVALTDNGDSWTLDNGIVKITVAKNSGRLTSLNYHGRETLSRNSEGWEQYPTAAARTGGLTDSVTIDPAKNGGERAEVSVKGINNGDAVFGSGVGGGTYCDLEVRYTLGRGDSGFYTYQIFTHPAGYRGTSPGGESRFINQLTPNFNWLSVDQDRNLPMVSNADTRTGVVVHAKEQRIISTGIYQNSVEHKYSYCAEMYKLPAYGWSSIDDHVGIWFINPSNEYIGGGPTRLDLVCHMGATMLDYWMSGHYAGGVQCYVNQGEDWNKVVGPIYCYCNALQSFEPTTQAELDTLKATSGNPTIPASWTANANALFDDALAKAKTIEAQWPFTWVKGVDYPQKAERATVTGQLALNDPQASTTKLPHLWVGLAHPDYTGQTSAYAARSGNGALVTWNHDAKYYEFWAQGGDDGKFTLNNVRPGTYTLHAFADGVLGELAQANITVAAGQNLDLGKIDWKPVRYGKQLWDIGTPSRNSSEFLKGDGADYWLWGWPLRYALLFPNDLTYTVGKSDYHKDWFFEEVPHATNLSFVNPAAKDPANQRFGWVKAESLDQYPQTDQTGPWRVYGRGRATTWTIKFNLDKPAQGSAVLRFALAGADGNGGLAIGVNGKDVGSIYPTATNALRYNTDRGQWQERDLTFDATLLKPGENSLTLTVPAGEVTTGVVYDYLRLELNEYYKPDGTPIPGPKS
ncbi:MAG TPA: polysaccharide lyase family protein [Opitutales bacterium]|nr:polysaccharide lyase family protein [Opitutales bacterium]